MDHNEFKVGDYCFVTSDQDPYREKYIGKLAKIITSVSAAGCIKVQFMCDQKIYVWEMRKIQVLTNEEAMIYLLET